MTKLFLHKIISESIQSIILNETNDEKDTNSKKEHDLESIARERKPFILHYGLECAPHFNNLKSAQCFWHIFMSLLNPSEKAHVNKMLSKQRCEQYAAMPEEKRAELIAKISARRRERITNMTPEELKAFKEKQKKSNKDYIARLSPEKKAERNKKQSEYYANMSDEKKQELLRKSREASKNMSKEQREKKEARRKERIANMTPEELEAYRQKRRESTARSKAKKRLAQQQNQTDKE